MVMLRDCCDGFGVGGLVVDGRVGLVDATADFGELSRRRDRGCVGEAAPAA